MKSPECNDGSCDVDARTITRRERERRRHRREILEAATVLFAEKGYIGTTMQDIADRAEFAVGTIYRFFESKDILFGELAVDVFEKVTQRLLEVLKTEGDAIERLKRYSMAAFDEMSGKQLLARLFFSGSGMPFMTLSHVNERLGELQASLAHAVISEIKRGIDRGQFIDKDPEVLSRMFRQLLYGYMIMLIDDEQITPEKWIDAMDATFFRGMTK